MTGILAEMGKNKKHKMIMVNVLWHGRPVTDRPIKKS
jgi:hypothetical protein